MSRELRIFIDSFFPILITGLKVTIPLTLIVFILGTLLAVIVAIIRIRKIKVLSQISWFYVWIIRGTPLIVQLFIVFFGLPKMGIIIPAIPAAIITFTLSVGAYSSEIVRSAILAVPTGQWEAAEALGFSYIQMMIKVILPQATKIAVPPLFNSFISLVKDTSLASTITVTEMFLATQRITARTYEPFILYIEVGLIYLIFCSVLTWLQSKVEDKLSFNKGKSIKKKEKSYVEVN
ncbi:amino acid ABC transporter permease [Tissierella creatinophila]|uniref:L-cystine transport system permease protein TcyB n=1 Tax=Tissierella creatinophila DSM 6911 TaxID=1123403 RepID=A0A1U7M2F4_TISCR|nr:amino acid ABC transporter permease [Tissierella creatinophila]OLS01494.1 L-cystine transport system permease protein TcyB [Tissierella creatinophila DSM 6911]